MEDAALLPRGRALGDDCDGLGKESQQRGRTYYLLCAPSTKVFSPSVFPRTL